MLFSSENFEKQGKKTETLNLSKFESCTAESLKSILHPLTPEEINYCIDQWWLIPTDDYFVVANWMEWKLDDFCKLPKGNRNIKIFTDEELYLLIKKKYFTGQNNENVAEWYEKRIKRFHDLIRAKYFLDNPNDDCNISDYVVKEYLNKEYPEFWKFLIENWNQQKTLMDYLVEINVLYEDFLPCDGVDIQDILEKFHKDHDSAYAEFQNYKKSELKSFMDDYYNEKGQPNEEIWDIYPEDEF